MQEIKQADYLASSISKQVSKVRNPIILRAEIRGEQKSYRLFVGSRPLCQANNVKNLVDVAIKSLLSLRKLVGLEAIEEDEPLT